MSFKILLQYDVVICFDRVVLMYPAFITAADSQIGSARFNSKLLNDILSEETVLNYWLE